MRLNRFCLVFLMMVAGVCAQTTGVPGVNDLTVNGQGSGATSCVNVGINSGDPWTSASSTHPFSAMVGAVSNVCAPNDYPIDALYSVDIEADFLDFIYDGTGTWLPTSLSPFAVANSAGNFTVTITTTELYRITFPFQMGMINTAFPNGVGTSQAFAINIRAFPILPNGVDLSPLSDDGSIQMVFGNLAGFTFYGTTYSDVYVNMNGNLTFLNGDSDWTPSESEMLSGDPRIAPAWDDWTPNDALQGTVRYEDTAAYFAVEWNDVRHFGTAACGGNNQDSNTFAAFLNYATGDIEFGYGPMLLCGQGTGPSTDQIVGISPGLTASVANNIDLSIPHAGGPTLAMYEDFGQGTYGPFDFSHLTCCTGQFIVFTPALGGIAYNQTVQ